MNVALKDATLLSANKDVIYSCEYIVVLCSADEDGIEILSRGGSYEDPLIGRRATTRVTSRPSVELGHLGETLVEFDQELFAPSVTYFAGSSLDKKKYKSLRLSLWVFEVAFTAVPHAREDTVAPGHFDEHGRLPLPCDPDRLPMAADGRFKPVAYRENFHVTLVGICPLWVSAVPSDRLYKQADGSETHINVQEGERDAAGKAAASTPSRSMPVLQSFTVYSPECLFTFFGRSPLLPSHIRSQFPVKPTVSSLSIIGHLRCRSTLKPGNRRPIIPNRFLVIPGSPNRALSDSVGKGSAGRPSQAFVRGVYIHIVRITDVPLETVILPIDGLQDQAASLHPFSNDVFEAFRRSHELRLFWDRDDEQPIGGAPWKMLSKKLQAVPLKDGPPLKHKKLIWSSSDIAFSSFGRTPILSSGGLMSGVDFKINARVYFTLPADGCHRLQCHFIIRPTVKEIFVGCQPLQLKPSVTLKMSVPLDVARSVAGSPFNVPLAEDDGPSEAFRGLVCLRVNPYPDGAVFLKPEMTWKANVPVPFAEEANTDFFITPSAISFDYTNVYSLFSTRVLPTSPLLCTAPVRGLESSSAKTSPRIVKSYMDEVTTFFDSFDIDRDEPPEDEMPSFPAAERVCIVTGNPGPEAIVGESYTMLMNVAPFGPSEWGGERAIFRSAKGHKQDWDPETLMDRITLELVSQVSNLVVSTSFVEDRGTRIPPNDHGMLRVNDNFEWSLQPSEIPYMYTIVYKVLRAGAYRLHIFLNGVDIAGSPYTVLAAAGAPEAVETRLDPTTDPEHYCYASIAEQWDISSSIGFLFNASARGHSQFDRFRALPGGEVYDNVLRFLLYDKSGTQLRCGGYLLSARALSEDVEVCRVVDNGDGRYEVIYRVIVPPPVDGGRSALSFKIPPRLEVFLNGCPVFGSPFFLKPQNVERIGDYYEKVLQALRFVSPVGEVEKQLRNHNIHSALETAVAYSQMAETREREALAFVMALSNILTTYRSASVGVAERLRKAFDAMRTGKDLNQWREAEQVLRNLQQRWFYAQRLREQLELFQTQIAVHHDTEGSISAIIETYSDGVAAALQQITSDIEDLKAFREGPLEVLVEHYDRLSDERAELLTRDLVVLVQKLKENNFDSMEELKCLQLRLAQELRKLHRNDLANRIEDIGELTLAEVDLRWQRFTLEWKAKTIESLDDILRSREMSLQFVQNNVKESLRQAPGGEKKGEGSDKTTADSESVWEMPPFTEDECIQTEDPLSCLDSKLAAMIVYRATGKSPCSAMPEDDVTVCALARGNAMGSALQKFWKPPRTSEIVRMRKLLQACPRIRFAVEEVFYFFSHSSSDSMIEALKRNAPSPGVPWEAYKRLCSGLQLSPLLLQDATALRQLFLKFSSEFKNNLSSSMGFIRALCWPLWPAFLRELGHLDTLATFIQAQQLEAVRPISRLVSFHYFLSRRFLPFYARLVGKSDNMPYRPLLPPFKRPSDMKQLSQKAVPSAPWTLEEMEKRVLEAAYRTLNYAKLKEAFDMLRTALSFPQEGTLTSEAKEKRVVKDPNTISFNRFQLYLSSIGFTPTYLDSEQCVRLASYVLKRRQTRVPSVIGLGRMTFDAFIEAICRVLAATADESLRDLQRVAVNPIVQMENIFLQLSDIAVIVDWAE